MKGWLFVLMVVVVGLEGLSAQGVQYIAFWKYSGCLEDEVAYNATETTTIYTPPQAPMLYVKAHGLWGIQYCDDDSVSCNGERLLRSSASGSVRCLPLPLPSNAEGLRLTRYGDPDQNERRIDLFSDDGFLGNHVSVDEEGGSNYRFLVHSFFFTGANSWTLIEAGSGNAICLNHSINQGDNGITFSTHLNTPLIIASVTFGCHQATTTTTPVTTPMISSSTTSPSTTSPTPDTTTQSPPTTPRSNSGHLMTNCHLGLLIATLAFVYFTVAIIY